MRPLTFNVMAGLHFVVNICTRIMEFLQFTILGLAHFFCVLCFIKVKLSVKVKLTVPLLCLCAFCLKGPSPK